MGEDKYAQIGLEMANQHQTSSGQMFGKPCLKTSNKAFAAFFKGEMVFKLGKDEVNLLKDKYPNAVNWDPSGKGRPMKDWLQVPEEFNADWEKLALEAKAFVESNL